MGNRVGPKLLLSSFLMVSIVACIGYASAGAEFEMDQDLKDSTASFLGESRNDQSGTIVAGVGDVNGDGFDDIAIGAWANDEGGNNTGQVYLIFGTASGFSMDTNLSKSDASFLGEHTHDQAGRYISGAGDVNGDGYDDILIGVTENDEGGESAGQVYLILGKASGWAMHTNLSKADASFWTPGIGKNVGWSIAGAEDVNGDGHDDFLIGVDFDSERGAYAGKVYLFFGGATGWVMDTNLSTANVTFLGMGSGDFAGQSVAGAGDVNGDGYDDILIGAPGYDLRPTVKDNGQTYLVFGKPSGWSATTYLIRSNASFIGSTGWRLGHDVAGVGDVNGDGFDDVLISQFDNKGIYYLVLGKATGWAMDTSILQSYETIFTGEHSSDWAVCANGAGDVNGDGYDDLLFGALGNGEAGNNAGQSYLIIGRVSQWPDLQNADASFLGEASHNNAGTSVAWAGDYNGDGSDDLLIGAPFYWEGEYGAGQTYLICYDFIPPMINNITTPLNASTGDAWTLNVSVSDNVGIDNVTVEFWYGDSQEHFNYSAIRSSGSIQNGTWFLNITILNDTVGPLHYVVHVRDTMDLGTNSQVSEVQVHDNDPPDVDTTMMPITATTGDEFTFIVKVTDNIGLHSVVVRYYYGMLSDFQTATMTRSSGDMWASTMTIPSDSLDTLHYFIFALDISGVFFITDLRDVIVEDNDRPVFEEDPSPMDATTGEDLIIYIQVKDNIAVAGVWMHYRYGDEAHSNVTMVRTDGDLWEIILTADHTLEDIQYRVGAVDTSGNVNWTDWVTVTITDNDPPEIVEDLSDEFPTTGDVYRARVRVWDNIGIASVSSVAPWTPTDVDENGNGLYEFEIPIDADYVGRFYLTITITDLSGNEGVFELASREVVDDDPPVIDFELPVKEAVKGLELNLPLQVIDNIGVEGVYFVFRYGDGPPVNNSVEEDVGLDIPRYPDGDLHFQISAVDAVGNWNMTGEFTVPLINKPPYYAGALGSWEVIEGTNATLDLAPHFRDSNDPLTSLTVKCSDDNITVEGLVLSVRHDVYIPETGFILNISDGEDWIIISRSIRVINVNDLPVITDLIPVTGTKFREDQKIVLSVTTEDEEGDEVTVTWKNGDQVLGTGSPLEVKLKPGEHIITVVVDDGTDQVEESFTVIVKKEEESPGPGLVVALAAVVLAGLVRVRRRGRRPA